MHKIIIVIIYLSFLNTINVYSQLGWIKLHPDTANYFTALYFTQVDTGYLGTSAGTIQKTINGGINWTQQNSGSSQWIHSFDFINSNTGFYVGTYGVVCKTINGGINWNLIDSLNTELFSIRFVNSNLGYTVGHQGAIFKTTSGGSSWLLQNSNTTNDLFSICLLNSNTGFIVGLNGKILKTTNGGNNWISQNSNVSNLLRSAYFVDVNTGYAAGDNVILKTTNSGLNWNIVLTSYPLLNVFFITSQIGYAVGYNGNILKTINGGTNWDLQISGTNSVLTNIFFSNINTGYVVGGEFNNFGIILKTTNGGAIGIKPISKNTPKQFKLQQNYPNPFNPVTHLRFEIPDLRFVKLTVFDVLGREIQTLVNEQLQPGTYEVEWNAVNYPSGIYYYRLITENFTETKKMILIK